MAITTISYMFSKVYKKAQKWNCHVVSPKLIQGRCFSIRSSVNLLTSLDTFPK